MEIYKTKDIRMEGGSASIYENPYLSFEGMPIVTFGSFKAYTIETAKQLILEVEAEVRKKKENCFLIGPMNGSTWDDYRWPLHSEKPYFFMESVHENFYHDALKGLNFEVIGKYASNLQKQTGIDHSFLEAKRLELKSQGYYLKTGIYSLNVPLSKVLSEIAEMSNVAYQNNFLFSPCTVEYFVAKYEKILPMIDSSLIQLLFDSNDELSAYLFSFKDPVLDQTLVVKSLAKTQSLEIKGVAKYLIYESCDSYKPNQIIHAYIHQGNAASLTVSKQLDIEVYRKYMLYGKEICI
ncbi:MAG: hypothetical protein MRY83_05470 [Flavobacteriales bacterium]|nr:hypothetical protein [Flavobacteriales bacterium]